VETKKSPKLSTRLSMLLLVGTAFALGIAADRAGLLSAPEAEAVAPATVALQDATAALADRDVYYLSLIHI